ncbi:MAG: ubiquinol oxidase subunit II [Pseudomonadota bacterium]
MRSLKLITLLIAVLAIAGCNLVVLNPSGDVAAQQGDLIIYATVLMLIVIIPVLALTVFFAFKYRASNEKSSYDPEWDHSVSLEIVVWSVPLAIIICLAGLTWVATHRLDPYQDLRRISAERPIDESVEPMEIQVVSLNWKWLFLYPEYGIATVNEVATIVDRPVEFKLTSATVMNAFYIPEMAGMIYAMAGMETELNAVLNMPGQFEGFSANYSGNGFSQMRFDVHAYEEENFDAWVDTVRSAPQALTSTTYVQLEQPSVDHRIEHFSSVEEGIWRKILNMCVGGGGLCLDDMMMVDALGGGGIEGLFNREVFAGICSADDPAATLAILKPELKFRQGEILSAMSLIPPESNIYSN